jgi:hypothetical protein
MYEVSVSLTQFVHGRYVQTRLLVSAVGSKRKAALTRPRPSAENRL